MTSTDDPCTLDVLSVRLAKLLELATLRAEGIGAMPVAMHAAWRGGIDGRAITPDGTVDDRLTRKLRGELSYWIEDAGATGSERRRQFNDRWTFYHRQRLGELAWTLRLESAEAFAAWVADRSVVEVGGGPFPAVSLLSCRRAIAIDPLAEAYVTGGLVPSRASGVVHIAAPAERLPLPQGSADLVICENCLDHVEDPTLAMREISRLLTTGGLLWLLVDLMEHRDELHPNPMSQQRLAAILREAGVEVLYEATWDGASHPEAKRQTRLLAWKPDPAKANRPRVRLEPGRIADSAIIGGR